MADEGLKDFTTTFILGGLLLFCLLAFVITFMYNNNSNALDDGTENILNEAHTNLTSRLTETRESSNNILNITANTNPEVSDLGSRDVVAVSFGTTSSSKSFFETSRKLISWVFSGTSGVILIGVFGGLTSFIMVFLIWRFIKSGY